MANALAPDWYNQRPVGFEDLRALRPMLEAQGKWNPAWDAALSDPAYYSSQQEGESGMLGSPASKAADLNALQGYTMAERRGDGRQGIAAYFDPSGNMGPARSFERGGSMHSGDWATLGSVIGGVLGGGYALSGGLGGAAGGAAAGGGGAAEAGLIGGDLMAGYGSGAMGADMAAGLVAPGAAGSGASLAAPGAFGAGGGLMSGAGSTYMGASNTGTGAGSGDYGLSDPGLYAEADGAGGVNYVDPASYSGGGGGSNLGQGLTDFFTGNGSMSDYARAAQTLAGLYTTNRATNAARQGAEAQNALIREAMAKNQPLIDTRNNALGQINGLMADPSSITKDPGYQFGLNQGQNQINNSLAAKGGYYSGQQLKASQQFGQDYAGTKLDQTYNRLLGVINPGQQASAQNTNLSLNLGQNAATQGNIRGSGYIGMGNTVNNGLGNWVNDWTNRKAWGEPG